MKSPRAFSLLVFVLLVSLASIYAQNTPICTGQIPSAIQAVTSRSEFANSKWGIFSKAMFPNPPNQPPFPYELYLNNIDEGLTPASNTKLFSNAATFLKYGTSTQFETKFVGVVPNVTANTDIWSTPTATGTLPGGRLYARGVTTSAGILYMFGDSSTNDIYAFDTNTNVWSVVPVTGARPVARYAHTQVLTPDETAIYIFGGTTGSRQNDINKFDLVTKTWTLLNPTGTKPAVRTLAAGVATRFGTVLIFGGGQGSTAFFNDIRKYDIASNAWVATTVNGVAPSPRSGVTAVLTKDNIMVVFGGHFENTPYNDVSKYDTATDTWLTVPTPSGAIPPARFDHSVVLTPDNFMIVFGGNNDNSGLFNDIAKYNVSENKWHYPPTTGTTPPALYSSVLAFNNKTQTLTVWGGSSSSTNFNTLYSLKYLRPSPLPASVTVDTLCVVASADPYLTTAQIAQTLTSLRARGVVAINNLYVDNSAYPGQTVPDTWAGTGFATTYPVGGGFFVDRSATRFSVLPAATAGSPAIVKFNNPADVNSVPYTNNVVTTASGTTSSVSIAFAANYSGIVISGQIAVGASARAFSTPAYPSDVYTKGRIQYFLGQSGISYANSVLGACPISSPVATSIKSQTTNDLLKVTLQESDNPNSEQFVRRLGADAAVKTGNNLQDGLAEIKRILNNQLGSINLNQVIINDGSGLSYENKFTARTIVQLLEQIDTRLPKNSSATFKSYLPLSGVSGTLDGRYGVGEAARGIVRAKTGTLTGVSALSGYLEKPDVNEPRQIFSVLLNTPSSVGTATRERGIDDIVNILARWDYQC